MRVLTFGTPFGLWKLNLGINYEINYGITRNKLENTLGTWQIFGECHWELVGTWWEQHNPKKINILPPRKHDGCISTCFHWLHENIISKTIC
jgi:hypothetical protein